MKGFAGGKCLVEVAVYSKYCLNTEHQAEPCLFYSTEHNILYLI